MKHTHEGDSHASHYDDHATAQATVKDPVCGMDVVPGEAKGGRFSFEGTTYHFCGVGCRRRFQADPAQYLAPEAIAPVPAGVDYTCPMHPEILQSGPGACPICGMALEPKLIRLGEENNPELEDMTRRFWVSLAFAAPVFMLAMSEMIPGAPVQHALGAKLIIWIQLALSAPAVLWGGRPLFQRGWQSLVHRSLNMFTLISLGTGVAFTYSLVATVAPGIFPAAFRGQDVEAPAGQPRHCPPGTPLCRMR